MAYTYGHTRQQYSPLYKTIFSFGPVVSPHVYIIPKYARQPSPAAQVIDRLIGTSFTGPRNPQITRLSVDFHKVVHKRGSIGAFHPPHQLFLRTAIKESVGPLPVPVVLNSSRWFDVGPTGLDDSLEQGKLWRLWEISL